MKISHFLAALALLSLAACAKPVVVTQPLPSEAVGHIQVKEISVSYADTVAETIKEDDAERAAKVADGETEGGYVDLAFTDMIAAVVKDTLGEAGITGPISVDLEISIDTLKFVNAAASILIGDNDQLAGIVTVKDSSTGEHVGEFYIDVLNTRAGLLGLALRGTGVREKLAKEFADHVAEQLSPEDKG